jgi:hypothetical protein
VLGSLTTAAKYTDYPGFLLICIMFCALYVSFGSLTREAPARAGPSREDITRCIWVSLSCARLPQWMARALWYDPAHHM